QLAEGLALVGDRGAGHGSPQGEGRKACHAGRRKDNGMPVGRFAWLASRRLLRHTPAREWGECMDCVDLDALEGEARERMAPASYAFCACGADDEISMAENAAAWRSLRLRPRVLR